MKWNDKQNRIIYNNYNEFIELQKSRMKVFSKFDPKVAPHILYDLKRFYKFVNKNYAILDAGCRDGWAMARMAHDGYPEVYGIDVVKEAVQSCCGKGFRVTEQNCEGTTFEDSYFDAIFCRHTLEHVIAPLNALREFVRITKSGGVIDIIVPIEPATKSRELKFGHSYVFESSSDFIQLSSKVPVKIEFQADSEKTLSGIASTFVLKVVK